LIEKCLAEENFQILQSIFKLDILNIAEMKEFYRKIALKLPK